MKMNKLIRNYGMLLFMAAAWGGCAQEDLTTTPGGESKHVTLIAAINGDAPQTRIDFADNGEQGIDLKWSEGDKFTVYNKADGKRVGNFVLKSGKGGDKQGEFEAEGTLDMPSGDYTAVYPAVVESSYEADNVYSNIKRNTAGYSVTEDNLAELNKMMYMETEFAYDPANASTSLDFEHQYAMLTMVLKSQTGIDGVPIKVAMHSSGNGNYADAVLKVADWSSDIKVYTMMQPGSGQRDLTFTVTTSTGKAYEKTIPTDKEYKAGKRYTATLDGFNKVTGEVTLASFSTGVPASDLWIITDAEATTEDFADLKAKLNWLQDSGCKIEIIFPNLKEIPDNALSDAYALALVSLSLPEVTKIGEYGFRFCESLAFIHLPKVETINAHALYATGLTSIDLPLVKDVGELVFGECYSLTSVNMPKVETLDDWVFHLCTHLQTLNVATQSKLHHFGVINGEGMFGIDTDPSKITLTTNKNNGTVVDNKWTIPAMVLGEMGVPTGDLEDYEYGPFKEVIQVD